MTSTADLTQGRIRRQLTALALPLLASNILQQLYNTVDVAIVGRYVGNEAFAAVGVAGSVMRSYNGFFHVRICPSHKGNSGAWQRRVVGSRY